MTIPLTPKQSRSVNALVRRECCNYDNGDCILLDCTCPQTITYSHIICKWFKTAVLPLDKELYIQLAKPPHTKICAVCGKPFIFKGNKESIAIDVKFMSDAGSRCNTSRNTKETKVKD